MRLLAVYRSRASKRCLQWKSRVDFRTGTVGFDNQIAAKMAHTLAHSPDAHSRALGLNRSQSFRRHSLSLVFNLYVDRVLFAIKSNERSLAFRVTMNVCQAFLHKAEYDEFHFGGKSSEIVRNLQINFQTAALRKTLHVPTQCGRNSGFIQQRWMQKIGGCA